MLICLAGALMVCIGLVHWWPVDGKRPPATGSAPAREIIQLEAIAPTRHETAPPPPPSVGPPISVPEPIMLSDEPLDLEMAWQEPGPETGEGSGGAGADGEAGGRLSQKPPQPVHFAEPRFPRRAWTRKASAQIVVRLQVNRDGGVTEARIVDRYRLESNDPDRSVSAACCSKNIMQRDLAPESERSRVNHLEYGLEDAALAAAWKWRFQPPTENGTPMRSVAILTFTFGQ